MSIHINSKKDDIAKIVLMPGDPLRARYIATKYLENAIEVNNVRNMLAFTGYYKGKKVSVMASGMGISSMGIYAYELFNDYGVEKIIRLGTCGAYDNSLHLRDTIIVDKSYTDSNFAYNFNSEKIYEISSSSSLMNKLSESAKNSNIDVIYGNVLSSEVFYRNNKFYQEYIENNHVIAVEMESFALFYTAKVLKKEASCILTVSDCVFPNDYGELSQLEKQESIDNMIIIALNSIL